MPGVYTAHTDIIIIYIAGILLFSYLSDVFVNNWAYELTKNQYLIHHEVNTFHLKRQCMAKELFGMAMKKARLAYLSGQSKLNEVDSA